jgi:hypothetical protein
VKKKLITEIERYKQLMGVVLITEAGKIADDYLPLTPRSIDNLTKSGIDFSNDLSKLSDEFTSRGIKTFDDLSKVVAEKQGLSVNNITDDMIRQYIKSDQKLYDSILLKASQAADKQVNILMKNVNIEKIFSKNPSQLNTYRVYISTPPSERNIKVLSEGLSDSIDELGGLIDDIQRGRVSGISVIPDELMELYNNLLSKKAEVDEFINRKPTPQVSKNIPTEVKWGNLGKGFTISNKITNYDGRYVVMVKDSNGRLRPFYQRTGGGGANEAWAAKGNWVPFYGIADVTLKIYNKETQQYELRRVTGWMIKPENNRTGEDGDDIISRMIGDVVGTNGIKDVDYGLGNFSKSITTTNSDSGMNSWLRSFGYEITPQSGYLKVLQPPNIIHGIP